MRIQYASDIHLEQVDNRCFMAQSPFTVTGEVLVLAGDTFPLKDFDSYSRHTWFDWCSANYLETLIVPGNHDYYGSIVDEYPESWERELRHNVHMCQNKCVILNGVEFILSTMWTHIPPRDWLHVRRGIRDFTDIRTAAGPFTATDYNDLHQHDLAFIQRAIDSSEAEHKVVVTHHLPSKLCLAPEFKHSDIVNGFVVDLTDYIKKSDIDVWIHGHTHRSVDATIGSTRVVTNQVGYVLYREYKENFNGSKYIEV